MTRCERLVIFFYIVENGIGLFDLLLWFGFHHFPYAKSPTVEHPGHRTGRREVRGVIALGSQRLQSRLGRQTCRGQRGAKCRILLGRRLSQLTQSRGHVGMLVFPACAATAGGLCPKAQDAGTPFGKAQFTVCRPQPNMFSAWRASPPQYFSVISASKERRVAPVIFEAAKRISARCSGGGMEESAVVEQA